MTSPHRRRLLSLVIGVGGLLTLLPVGVHADSTPVGVITTVDGSGTIARAAISSVMPLRPRESVFVSDRIATADRSIARILLGGKALVTVRERSVLTVTEGPGTARVDVAHGKVAVAVAKDRMRPGDSVEIRTPNAVAAIRGTVVIAEVVPASPGSARPETTITVLRGVVEFRPLDVATRQPVGAPVMLGKLQSIRVAAMDPPSAVQAVTPQAAERLTTDLRTPVRDASSATRQAVVAEHVRDVVTAVQAAVTPGATGAPAPPGADVKAERSSDTKQQDVEPSGTGSAAAAAAPAASSRPAGTPAADRSRAEPPRGLVDGGPSVGKSSAPDAAGRSPAGHGGAAPVSAPAAAAVSAPVGVPAAAWSLPGAAHGLGGRDLGAAGAPGLLSNPANAAPAGPPPVPPSVGPAPPPAIVPVTTPSPQHGIATGVNLHDPSGVGDLRPGRPGSDGPGKSAPKISPGNPGGGGGKKP